MAINLDLPPLRRGETFRGPRAVSLRVTADNTPTPLLSARLGIRTRAGEPIALLTATITAGVADFADLEGTTTATWPQGVHLWDLSATSAYGTDVLFAGQIIVTNSPTAP
jgi:hypothetical protein